MKKLILLTLALIVASCQSSNTVSEEDSQTFEKNVQTIKDTWIQGYEQENFDQVVSLMADSIQWNGIHSNFIQSDLIPCNSIESDSIHVKSIESDPV